MRSHSPIRTTFASRPRRAALIAALAVAVLSFSGFLLRAQYISGGKAKGFKFPEFYPVSEKVPRNRLKYLVTGGEAEPFSAKLVALKDMRLESYSTEGSTNFIAKTPQCMVYLENRSISQINSTSRLEMLTGDGRFFIEGNEGFLCHLTNDFSMIISNHVRTIIHHGLLNLPEK